MSLGFASRKHRAAAPQETQAAAPPETRDFRGYAAENLKRWRAGRAHSGVMSAHRAGFRFSVTGGAVPATHGFGPGKTPRTPPSPISCFARRSRACFNAAKRASRPGGR